LAGTVVSERMLFLDESFTEMTTSQRICNLSINLTQYDGLFPFADVEEKRRRPNHPIIDGKSTPSEDVETTSYIPLGIVCDVP
jgi:hypothetical protein